MTYTKVDPVPISTLLNTSIKAVDKTTMLLLEDDMKSLDVNFIGALLLQGSEGPFDLIALLDVKEIRTLARSLWDMANHLIEIRIELEIAKLEKKKPRRKRKK